MELLLIAALSFGGGYWYGSSNVVIECSNKPLVVANCVEIEPPTDKSFGASMNGYSNLVTTYRKCKAACVEAVR